MRTDTVEVADMTPASLVAAKSKLVRRLATHKNHLLIGAVLFALSVPAQADFTDLYNQGLLVGYTEKEVESALASQAVYNQLRATAGCLDNSTAGATGDAQPATCSGGTYRVWKNVREVVHNANVLTPNNQGPTRFTLRRPTVALLGRALQWCNGEELASLNSLSTSFVGSQISNLASRVTALRMGATGFQASNFLFNGQSLAANKPTRGGGASADDHYDDDASAQWSTWGGFLTGTYVNGDKLATSQENAFEFMGPSITLGVDNRIDEHWVVGGIVGYQQQELNFATVATVEGYSDLSGFSVMPFALYQSDRWYFNMSVGYQSTQFDTHRRVNYGSGASPTGSITVSHNTFDVSNSKANGFSSYDTLGFTFRPTKMLSLEPSLSVDYQNTTIGEFTEQDLNNEGFAFKVAEQSFKSLEVAPALRAQMTFTPGRSVLMPYIDAQWRHQMKSDPRIVNAIYADAQASLTTAASFSIKTDAPDQDYQVYSAGLSAVIRGSTNSDGHASGGMQIFANYKQFVGLENITEYEVAAGFRYEF